MRRPAVLATVLSVLTHPLIVVGLAVLVLFGLYERLIEAGIFQPLTQGDSASLLGVLLGHGFWIALAVIVLGFALQFYKLAPGRALVAARTEYADQVAARNRQTRQAMLARVRHMWVEDVLEQSLYQVARMELGLSEEPVAIERPWTLVVKQSEHAPRALPAGIPMVEVFDRFHQTSLLLLGEPGSGKTTLLLELARDLIERAKHDPTHPIPVVFNLSSWAEKRPSLAEWLVDELKKRYDVPLELAQAWIDNAQVLPLLDGLDEVVLDHREACAEAITAFRETHGLLPSVMCSRSADFKALSAPPLFPAAVTIEPLRREYVQRYLESGGAALSGVRAAVYQDETLWELLDTPLMLSILALAYQGRMGSPVRIARLKGDLEERRKRLFDAYIEAMFELFPGRYRVAELLYTPQQTRHWLSWLARVMVRHKQKEFFLDSMLTDWMSDSQIRSLYLTTQTDWLSKSQRRLHTLGTWFVITLVLAPIFGWIGGLLFGPLGVLLGVLFSWFSVGRIDVLAQPDYSSFGTLHENLGAIFSVVLVCALIAGLLFGLEAALLLGSFLVIGFTEMVALKEGLERRFTRGIRGQTPNALIRSSLRTALVFGLAYGLFFGMLFMPLVSTGPVEALAIGMAIGVSRMGDKGGMAVIQYWVMRVLLWRYDYAPLRYVRFLEHAKELLFLRRVGVGYIFVHRMLMEHFAEMEPVGGKQG
jgi:DNA polymerase III delta prime subunit